MIQWNIIQMSKGYALRISSGLLRFKKDRKKKKTKERTVGWRDRYCIDTSWVNFTMRPVSLGVVESGWKLGPLLANLILENQSNPTNGRTSWRDSLPSENGIARKQSHTHPTPFYFQGSHHIHRHSAIGPWICSQRRTRLPVESFDFDEKRWLSNWIWSKPNSWKNFFWTLTKVPSWSIRQAPFPTRVDPEPNAHFILKYQEFLPIYKSLEDRYK